MALAVVRANTLLIWCDRSWQEVQYPHTLMKGLPWMDGTSCGCGETWGMHQTGLCSKKNCHSMTAQQTVNKRGTCKGTVNRGQAGRQAGTGRKQEGQHWGTDGAYCILNTNKKQNKSLKGHLRTKWFWHSSLETLGEHLFLVCFDSCLMVNSDNQGKISWVQVQLQCIAFYSQYSFYSRNWFNERILQLWVQHI